MIIPILKFGAPELRIKSEWINKFDDELEEIVTNMMDTMYGSSGVGLAAPQIGINIQLITIDTSNGEDKDNAIVICNPEIIYSEGKQVEEEGCLSLPSFSENVARPTKINVKGQSLKGDETKIEAEGILARVFSHEIDHLNGILFIDHLSSLKRSLIKNKIKKLSKVGEW